MEARLTVACDATGEAPFDHAVARRGNDMHHRFFQADSTSLNPAVITGRGG